MKKLKLATFTTLMVSFNLTSFANRIPLVIYSPHAKPMLEQLEAKFEKENPDIDIILMPMGGSEALNRIKSEKNNPIANVYYGSPTTFFSDLKNENLLVKFEPNWSKDIAITDKDKDGYFNAPMITPMTIAIMNNSKLPEPNSWLDLNKKEYKDKIITFGASSSSIATFLAYITSLEGMSNGNNLTPKGEKWFKEFDKNVAERSDNAIIREKLSKKLDGIELTIVPVPTIEDYKSNGADLKTIFNLKEGVIGITDHIAIVSGTEKNTEKLTAAKTFVEFVGNEENQIYLANTFNRMPTLPSAKQKTTKTWMKSPMKFANINWDNISSNSKSWLEKIYNEIF